MIPVLIPEALRDLMGTPGVWALSRRVDPHFSDHWRCSSNSSCAGNWDLQQLNGPYKPSFHPSCKSFIIFDNNFLFSFAPPAFPTQLQPSPMWKLPGLEIPKVVFIFQIGLQPIQECYSRVMWIPTRNFTAGNQMLD